MAQREILTYARVFDNLAFNPNKNNRYRRKIPCNGQQLYSSISWYLLSFNVLDSNTSVHRHVARISSRRGPTWRGPRVPLPKTENSSDLAHYFWVRANLFFIFFFTIKFYFIFPLRGGHGPLAPPPPGYVPVCSSLRTCIEGKFHFFSRGHL